MSTTAQPSSNMSDIVLEAMNEIEASPDNNADLQSEYLDSPMSDEDIERELNGVETPEEVQTAAPAPKTDPASPLDIVQVQLDDGKTAKIKLDFNDKEAIKGFIAEHYAASRKAQALEQQIAQLQPDYQDMQSAFTSIEAAAEEGVEALVDLLYGKPGSFQQLLESEIERRETRKYATEAELAALDREDQLKKTARLTAAERKKLDAEKQSIEAQKAKAQEDALYSRLERQFNAIRVDGILGDSELEDFVNRAIWRESIDQLAELETKNPNIPDAAIKQIMADVSSKVRNKFQTTQKQAVQKAAASQKNEVQQKVAAKATSVANPTRQQMQESVNAKVDAGDIRGLTRLLLRGQ